MPLKIRIWKTAPCIFKNRFRNNRLLFAMGFGKTSVITLAKYSEILSYKKLVANLLNEVIKS